MPESLVPLCAMSADRKSVRLVAQPLQEIEHRVARVEREGRSRLYEETLSPGIAVRTLGDPDDRHVRDAELFEDALCDVELPLAAINQDEIGPCTSVAVRVLLERAAEAPQQHLAHHRIIVAAGGRLACLAPLTHQALRAWSPLSRIA